MTILLLGATGFIGSAIGRALTERGHVVTGLARDAGAAAARHPQLGWTGGDLRAMVTAADWAGPLTGIDTIINASGALQSGLRDDVPRVQGGAIAAMAQAARGAGVARIIQISASDAAIGADGAFMASKGAGDAAVTASGIDHAVLRPGLVIGRNAFGGTEMLRILACLPVPLLPPGSQPIRCVALDDVVAAVLAAVDAPAPLALTADLVAPDAQSLSAIVAAHRQWLGFAPAKRSVTVPGALVWALGKGADALGWLGWRSPLRSTAIAALRHGVGGRPQDAAQLIGRDCRSFDAIMAALPPAGKADRWHARLGAVYPLALAMLILFWAVSGVVGLVRWDAAAALLAGTSLPAHFARALVIAGSLADLALAAAMLFRPTLRRALLASVALTLAYCVAAIAVRPDLWVDPLGPMVKALLAVPLALLCLAMAEER